MSRYGELWHTRCKEDQMHKNIIFYIWFGDIDHAMGKVPHIPTEVIVEYNIIMRFKVSINHVYVQSIRDLDQQWVPCDFKID